MMGIVVGKRITEGEGLVCSPGLWLCLEEPSESKTMINVTMKEVKVYHG